MDTKQLLMQYFNLKMESGKLIEQWELLKANNVNGDKLKCVENEMKLIQRDKEHIAVRFIEEFLI